MTKKRFPITGKPFSAFKRKLGDSNPRYGNPYVSLANWWFQPLTQTSSTSRKCGAKVVLYLQMVKQNTKKIVLKHVFNAFYSILRLFCDYFVVFLS